MSGSSTQSLPRWADLVLLPAVCLAVALLVAGGVVAMVGQSPTEVIAVLVHGAFGTARGFSYTVYYATTFVFTGLAVAVASSLHQQYLIRRRDPADCFRAFLNNNLFGLAVFAGIALDYLFRS